MQGKKMGKKTLKIKPRGDLQKRKGVEIKSNLLRVAIAERGMSLGEFAEKVSVKVGTFHTYIQPSVKTGKLTKMPLAVYDRVREELGITDRSLEADGPGFDWRKDTEELVETVLMMVRSGDRKVEDYFDIFQKAAPYFLPRVHGSGSFDAEQFATALVAAQAAIAQGKPTPDISEVERQLMED